MPERINIKNLIIEPERQPERPFDPRTDFSAEDIRLIERLVKSETSYITMDELARFVFLKKPAAKLLEDSHRVSLLNKPNSDGIGVSGQLDEFVHRRVFNMGSKNLPESLHIQAQEYLKEKRGKAEKERDGKFHWASYAHDAAMYKVLGGKVEIPAPVWKALKELFDAYKQLKSTGDDAQTIMTATKLAILAADEVKVPLGGGLELVWHKKTEKLETPSQLSQRKF